MKPIISIDLWKTLIFSHPDFKRNRAARLLEHSKHNNELILNNLMLDFSTLEKSFDKYQIDLHGLQPENFRIEGDIVNLLRSYSINITFRKFLTIQYQCLEKYTPIFHPHLPTWLSALQEKYTLILVSNTMFIPGLHLYLLLESILSFFDVLKFSDEIGYGKPSRQILRDLNFTESIKYHIGDMIETDGKFASNIGAEFLHVTSENDVISIIESLLIKK